MFAPFTEWLPDQTALNNGGLSDLLNVVPAVKSYRPWKSAVAFTNALPSAPLGSFVARNPVNGDYVTFAGTAGKLYRLNTGTLAWDDVSKPATTYLASANDRWQFAQYGSFVVAVNINDFPQVFNLASSTTFDNLAGSPPKARFVAVWGDFLALGCLAGFPYRIQWSGLDNISFWTVGQQNSDFQDFGDGGYVQGLTSNNNPLILQEQCIRRGVFMPGSRQVFDFDKIHEERGARYPYAIASRGMITFFVNDEGFHQITSDGGYVPIGYQKVNETLLSDIDRTKINELLCFVDPIAPRAYWIYPANGSASLKMVSYDWVLKRWTPLTAQSVSLAIGYSLSSTLDDVVMSDMDMDSDMPSLDSTIYQGGIPMLSGFTYDFKLAAFSGDALEAMLVTGDVGDTGGTIVDGVQVKPVIERAVNSEVYVTVGGKRTQADDVWWYPERQPSEVTGAIKLRSRRRFHRVSVRIPSGSSWTHAQGVDVQGLKAGTF